MASKLDRAKKFSDYELFISEDARKKLEKSSLSRLELSYWEYIFDQIYLLGLELKKQDLASEVYAICRAARGLWGIANLNDWIERGKKKMVH